MKSLKSYDKLKITIGEENMENLRYALEDVMSYKNTDELYNIFFSLVKGEEATEDLKEILYEGKYHGLIFSTDKTNPNNPGIELERRVSMAYLYIRDNKTFKELMKEEITLYHGTNANALPSILKYGINSVDESKKQGIQVTTGEKSTRPTGTREFISLTDVLAVAEGYSTLTPEEKEPTLDFGVVFGIPTEGIRNLPRPMFLQTSVPELGILGNIPKERIKVILTEPSNVDFVRKIVKDSNIKVYPARDFQERFYYIDEGSYTIFIDYDKLETLKTAQEQEARRIKEEEIKNLAETRLLSRIKSQLDKIKKHLLKEEEEYGNRRTR